MNCYISGEIGLSCFKGRARKNHDRVYLRDEFSSDEESEWTDPDEFNDSQIKCISNTSSCTKRVEPGEIRPGDASTSKGKKFEFETARERVTTLNQKKLYLSY